MDLGSSWLLVKGVVLWLRDGMGANQCKTDVSQTAAVHDGLEELGRSIPSIFDVFFQPHFFRQLKSLQLRGQNMEFPEGNPVEFTLKPGEQMETPVVMKQQTRHGMSRQDL